VKEVKIQDEIAENYFVKEINSLKIGLNPVITQELKYEGLIRDLVREIQSARKKADFAIDDRIETTLVFDDDELKAAIKVWETYLKRETLSKKLLFEEQMIQEAEFVIESKIEDTAVKIGISRSKK
jgi:isoleucyl-tRNA synthetase